MQIQPTRVDGRKTHGLRGTPEYNAWVHIRHRCNNPKDRYFAIYGGRGIRVCDRWLGPSGLANFIADMGPRPSKLHSIDRVNNDGNYEPGNCRWATIGEQCRNRRTTRLLTFNGITQCMTDWAAQVGISRQVIFRRLKEGWDVGDALTIRPRPWPVSKSKQPS
jgi:hypothetical protein